MLDNTSGRSDDGAVGRDELERLVNDQINAAPEFLLKEALKNSQDMSSYFEDLFEATKNSKGQLDPYLDESREALLRDLKWISELVERASEIHQDGIASVIRDVEAAMAEEGGAVVPRLIEHWRSLPEGPTKSAASRILSRFFRTPKELP